MFSFLFSIQNLKEFFVTNSLFFSKATAKILRKNVFGPKLLLDFDNVYGVGP
jgi:hypothetical protein